MPLRRLQQQLDGPFTPVSPLNLEPLTSRFQQVSLQELAFINEHLSHNDSSSYHLHHHIPRSHTSRSGWSTPLASAGANGTLGPIDDYFSAVAFDEEDDKRAEVRADAERPFPVDRSVLKDIIHHHMCSSVVRMQFLSSGMFLLHSILTASYTGSRHRFDLQHRSAHQSFFSLEYNRNFPQSLSCRTRRRSRSRGPDRPTLHAPAQNRIGGSNYQLPPSTHIHSSADYLSLGCESI